MQLFEVFLRSRLLCHGLLRSYSIGGHKHSLDQDTALLKNDKNRLVCNVLLFLLSTGARVNEALKAEWKHIDRKGRTWTIPAANAKSKKARHIPLNDAAMQVLDDVHTEGSYAHIFVNRHTGERLKHIAKVWKRLRNEAGMPDLRIHDLRHAFCSILAQAGVPIYTISKLAGHSTVDVTQRYSHLAPETQQKASSIAADQILAALEGAA